MMMLVAGMCLVAGFLALSHALVGGRPSVPMSGRFLWFTVGMAAWGVGVLFIWYEFTH